MAKATKGKKGDSANASRSDETQTGKAEDALSGEDTLGEAGTGQPETGSIHGDETVAPVVTAGEGPESLPGGRDSTETGDDTFANPLIDEEPLGSTVPNDTESVAERDFGSDTVSVAGSTGDDTLLGETADAPAMDVGDTYGADTISGDAGADDTLLSDAADKDTVAGDDTLLGDVGASDTAMGEAVANDTVMGTAGTDDTLFGEAGGDSTVEDTLDAAIAPPPGRDPKPQVIRETVVERKGGFLPMVLGGLVAAGLGFVAALLYGGALPFGDDPDPFVEQTTQTLEDQSASIAALQAQMGDAEAAIGAADTGPLTASVAGIDGRLTEVAETVSGLDTRLGEIDARLTAVEKQPLEEAVSPEAIAAYERELETLRAAVQSQRAEVEAQRAEIETIAADAMASEQSAAVQASLAESRAALAEVTSELQAGQPYAAPLSIIEGNGVAVPGALSAHAADGVATQSSLIADFPDLSREALREARASAPEGDGGTLAGFFQNQLGARSVTPREGSDPDAVLSRAEAAVRNGALDTALNEIASLPEAGQAPLADWVARAEARRDALAAADTLAQDLNQQ